MPLPPLLRGALRALIAVDVFAMMALIFVDVFLRYLFNAPMAGAFEFIQFMLAFPDLLRPAAGDLDRGSYRRLDFRGPVPRPRAGRSAPVRAARQRLRAGVVAYLLWNQGFSMRNSGQITGFLELDLYPIAFVMSGLTVMALGIQVRDDRPMPCATVSDGSDR